MGLGGVCRICPVGVGGVLVGEGYLDDRQPDGGCLTGDVFKVPAPVFLVVAFGEAFDLGGDVICELSVAAVVERCLDVGEGLFGGALPAVCLWWLGGLCGFWERCVCEDGAEVLGECVNRRDVEGVGVVVGV